MAGNWVPNDEHKASMNMRPPAWWFLLLMMLVGICPGDALANAGPQARSSVTILTGPPLSVAFTSYSVMPFAQADRMGSPPANGVGITVWDERGLVSGWSILFSIEAEVQPRPVAVALDPRYLRVDLGNPDLSGFELRTLDSAPDRDMYQWSSRPGYGDGVYTLFFHGTPSGSTSLLLTMTINRAAP